MGFNRKFGCPLLVLSIKPPWGKPVIEIDLLWSLQANATTKK
jgi:hypothetical protein